MNDMAETFEAMDFPKLTESNGLGTDPVPVEPYVSQAWYEQERDQVFGRAWLCMGRIEQLPERNSFITRQVEICKTFILLTRDASGIVRAFHNVCAHRANMLVLEKEGKSSRFACNYHRWTYSNNGDCIGVPDASNFFNLDLKACGLTPIACDVWEGWIFVNLQKKPEVSLLEFLGEFGTRFKDIPAPSAAQSFTVVSNLRANWKVIADAFAETYHVPAIHPQTIGTTFSSKLNPFARPLSASAYGPHRSFSTFGNPDYQPPESAHVERLAYSTMDTGNVLGGDNSAEVAALLNHPAVNPTRSPGWAVDVAWLFPNFQIDFSPGGFWTHEFWPTSVNTTRWVARVHIPVAKDVYQRFQQEHHSARFADIMLEDVANTERQQLAMESGAKTEMQLQDGEFMLRHSMHVLKKWVEASTVREALS